MIYTIHINSSPVHIDQVLKINDLKTEFIVFRSPQLWYDLSGLSVNVGESQIMQSLKVRDFGFTFDEFLNFDDHITAINYVDAHIFILYIYYRI